MPHSRIFSIMEFAIILAAIGVISSGILLGREIIRAAEMRDTHLVIKEDQR